MIIDLKNCSSKEELFRIIESRFSFPDWWGKNWDALSDCLNDENLNKLNNETIDFILPKDVKKEEFLQKFFEILKESKIQFTKK